MRRLLRDSQRGFTCGGARLARHLRLAPAFRKMGKRLAEEGYSVLVVNPFYRTKKAPVAPDGTNTPIQEVFPLARSLSRRLTPTMPKLLSLGWMPNRSGQEQEDRNDRLLYGGPIVMRTAAAVPDRVGAGGSFHGGGLVTKNPDSPHTSFRHMKAQFLIAIAENDDQRDPESKTVLKETFAKANLEARLKSIPQVTAGAHPTRRYTTKSRPRKLGRDCWLSSKSVGLIETCFDWSLTLRISKRSILAVATMAVFVFMAVGWPASTF